MHRQAHVETAAPRDPPQPSQTDRAIEQVVEALTQAVDASTPWSRSTDKSKPGFTPECRELQKEAKRAYRDVVRYYAQHQKLFRSISAHSAQACRPQNPTADLSDLTIPSLSADHPITSRLGVFKLAGLNSIPSWVL
ncbi:hypothetical protein PENDEC_c003G04660 [Penicillium decumbens]|uniref:Uncharacterized protein n=1 Tax=Penicillium decumbens TaxID=69771 RepID=A0A1V6PKT3_PENDC|nr:hypothetical protein PENDEC_c003G04660 [Penicillium decumbens]